MFSPVGQKRTISLCAALLLTTPAARAATPPASRPAAAHPLRLDLLYLHARLLTSDAGLPESAHPVLDAAAARQKTWTTSPTPVALLTPDQVEELCSAFSVGPGVAVTPGTPAMLLPDRRVKTPSVASSADQPRFAIRAVAGPEDDQGALPLHLSITVTLPSSHGPKSASRRTWSTQLAVATPVEHTLLIDLTPKSDAGHPAVAAAAPRVFLLLRPSAEAVDRKDPAATARVVGELYRAWDRAWPLFTPLLAAIQDHQYADARKQAATLRDQLRPVLDAADGTDFAPVAAAVAEHLDATITALRRFEPDRAADSFRRFQRTGDDLHARLAHLLSDAGRLPPAPATRPRS